MIYRNYATDKTFANIEEVRKHIDENRLPAHVHSTNDYYTIKLKDGSFLVAIVYWVRMNTVKFFTYVKREQNGYVFQKAPTVDTSVKLVKQLLESVPESGFKIEIVDKLKRALENYKGV